MDDMRRILRKVTNPKDSPFELRKWPVGLERGQNRCPSDLRKIQTALYLETNGDTHEQCLVSMQRIILLWPMSCVLRTAQKSLEIHILGRCAVHEKFSGLTVDRLPESASILHRSPIRFGLKWMPFMLIAFEAFNTLHIQKVIKIMRDKKSFSELFKGIIKARPEKFPLRHHGL
jgi:hypothetical protein